MENLKKIKEASRRSAILSISGFLIIVLSLVYSAWQLSSLETSKTELKTEIKKNESLTKQQDERLRQLKQKVEKSTTDAERIKNEIENMELTQNSLLDFLVSVTDRKNVSILDPSVDWDAVKESLNQLPASKRKNAILNAILLAWKEIPFTMGHESVNTGFDSPRFLRYVLRTVGVNIEKIRGRRLSEVLMESFDKIDNPKPGDLVFFKGMEGNFGFILASVGKTDAEHVGIGTLQKIDPLQITSMGNINTPFFPLRGYYRVIYPDEKK